MPLGLTIAAMSVVAWEYSKPKTPVDPETEGSSGTLVDDQIPPATSGKQSSVQHEELPTGSTLKEVKAKVKAKIEKDSWLGDIASSVKSLGSGKSVSVWDRAEWRDVRAKEHGPSPGSGPFGDAECVIDWDGKTLDGFMK